LTRLKRAILIATGRDDDDDEAVCMLPTFTLDSTTLLRSFAVDTLPCDSHHILVACFPKSGSTWLSEVLSTLPGFAKIDLVPVYDRREQELAFERLLVAHHLDYVAQHHCRYSLATEHCLRAFSLRPVVLVRNIFDCVVSLKDHIDRGTHDPATRIGPLAHVPDAYYGFSQEARLDFVVDMCAPWYFNFFIGWQGCKEGLWVRYEDMLADPHATVRRITETFEIGASDAAIDAALATAAHRPTRRNVAVTGRGQTLSAAQRRRIEQFASYYPVRDFSLIGIARARAA